MKFFITTLSTVQVGAFPYSTCKRQARRRPSTPAIRCRGQARVDHKNPVSFSLRTSTRIHADSSSTAPTGRRSRPKLGCICFLKPRVFLSDPSKPHAAVRRSCETDDMATGRPPAPRSSEIRGAKPMAISRNVDHNPFPSTSVSLGFSELFFLSREIAVTCVNSYLREVMVYVCVVVVRACCS